LQSRAAIAAQDIFDNILDRRIEWPDGEGALSDAGRDLVDRLLQPDPAQRLGARGAGEARRGPARRPRLAGQGAACGRFHGRRQACACICIAHVKENRQYHAELCCDEVQGIHGCRLAAPLIRRVPRRMCTGSRVLHVP